MSEAIKPLFDRVVVKQVDADKQTASGIILPGKAAEQPNKGTVIAVGAGRKLESGKLTSMSVVVGDTVIYTDAAATNLVEVDGEEFLVMNEHDILGVLTV